MSALGAILRTVGTVVGTVTGLRGAFSGGGNRNQGASPTPTPSPAPAADATQSSSNRGAGMGATRYNLLSGGAQGVTDQPNLGRFRLLGG